MPYNTRRKSLSLSELGVHVPKRARAPSHASRTTPPMESDEPPTKKVKGTDGLVSSSPGAMSPPPQKNVRIKVEPPRPNVGGAEHTPPPSPGAAGVSRIDTEGIRDEIVVGVIHQLEKTGNRPHTSKELAAVLANVVPTIDSSTNPNALIQARLATYLKGPWPIVSPCPLGKQQESVHPRRVFYHLTTQPHQPIPQISHQSAPVRRVISPSLSSQADDDTEGKYSRDRSRMSPSPEVDLSSPELDDESDPEVASTFSGRNSMSRNVSYTNLSHNRRAQSPPLEREERDFKQTANELQEQRRNSQQRSDSANAPVATKSEENEDVQSVAMSVEMTDDAPDSAPGWNKEDAASLFGNQAHLAVSSHQTFDLSSPVLRPQNASMQIDAKPLLPSAITQDHSAFHKSIESMTLDHETNNAMDTWATWDDNGQLTSPEDIELDEVKDLFDAYY